MTVKELLDVIDKSRDSCIGLQVCTKDGDWEDYDFLHTHSAIMDSIADKEIKCMGAIETDVFRIDIDWENKSSVCKYYKKGYCICQGPEFVKVDCEGDTNKSNRDCP